VEVRVLSWAPKTLNYPCNQAVSGVFLWSIEAFMEHFMEHFVIDLSQDNRVT
jgi:hypothetical protein